MESSKTSIVGGGGVVVWHLAVARLTILGLTSETRVSTVHGGTSHVSFVAWTITRSRRASRHLSVAGIVNLLVALPEWSSTSTIGVVVLWAGAEALLFLVVARKQGLHNGGD